MRRRRTRLYCGKSISRRRLSPDFPLRVTFLVLVVVLAIAKLPDARAKVLGSSIFRLESIRVEGNRYLLDSQVLSVAGIEKGMCGLKLDGDAIRSRLLKHPRIKSTEVHKFLWKKLFIRVEERTSVALVDLGRLLEIDEDRVVFEPIHAAYVPDLPVITGLSANRVACGDTLDSQQVRQALALLERLKSAEVNLFGQISEIHVDKNGGLTMLALESAVPLFLGNEPVSLKKLQALKIALADMQRKELIPASVDLRFKDQIIARVARGSVSGAASPGEAAAPGAALF
ncbi:MAG: FtsQ-type POTRA domain-containing protein [Candidatus Eisenbacteria bacterium]